VHAARVEGAWLCVGAARGLGQKQLTSWRFSLGMQCRSGERRWVAACGVWRYPEEQRPQAATCPQTSAQAWVALDSPPCRLGEPVSLLSERPANVDSKRSSDSWMSSKSTCLWKHRASVVVCLQLRQSRRSRFQPVARKRQVEISTAMLMQPPETLSCPRWIVSVQLSP
jgi:hypothetical protein